MPADELVDIRFPGLPVRLTFATDEHMASLVRELRLISIGRETGTTDDVPGRLASLIDEVLAEFADVRMVGIEQGEAALEAGLDVVDMTIPMPPAAGPAIERLTALLEEADGWCARGELLTLAVPPEVVRLRRWFTAQVVGQLAGRPPVAWADWRPDAP